MGFPEEQIQQIVDPGTNWSAILTALAAVITALGTAAGIWFKYLRRR